MATEGAHVFRFRKVELAHQWMRTLDIKHYEPSLASLNFDFEPISQPASINPFPPARIDELPESSSQLTTKRVPVETWQMVRNLSDLLAKSVPRNKTPVPFKFNKCLQDAYERERTPQQSQAASVSSGTRSHDSPKQQASSRKRGLDEPSSNLHAQNDVGSPPGDVDSRPIKKKRAAAVKPNKPTANAEPTPDASLKRSTKNLTLANTELQRPLSPSPNVPDSPPRTLISFDWKTSTPQALVLDFLKKKDSPKIGVWFLPSQMVCSLLFPFRYLLIPS